MATSIDLKRNDHGITVEAVLSDSTGPIDLTDSTVRFLYEGNVLTCEIFDAPNGVVLTTFDRKNTQKPGVYQAEFEIEHSNDVIETVPSNGYVLSLIHI